MRLTKKINLTGQVYALMAIQLLLLGAAFLGWLISRGNLYQKTFTLDEYIVSENTVVKEDVTTDDTMSEGGDFVHTPEISLDKGTYYIYVNYNANAGDSIAHVGSRQMTSQEMHCLDTKLNPAYHTAVLPLDLSRDVTEFSVAASFSGHGYLSITGVSIVETTDRSKRNIVRAFALCLLLDLLYLFRKSDLSSRRIILALTAIFGITCYPLYLDYLPVGHDIPFHLLRIEGLSKGLSDHVFPVRIHPVWAKDHGYAVGVMYGNAFLYFPALLRHFGYSVQSAYKLYAAAVNLGTVVISYFAFKRMFRNKNLGLLGCLIYSLSIYRLIDVYTRAAVGEYTAMMFFPVILCGFYLIFTEASKDNWYRFAVLTALGITGLIQSHVLSCEMAALIILPVCLILIRRVCQRHTFTALAAAAVLSVLLNLGFLVPFLDYYNTDLLISSDQWAGNTSDRFQAMGVFPVQIFALFGHGTGSTLVSASGASYECTMSIGIFFLLGLLLFLYLLLCHYRECRSRNGFIPACICTAFACLLLYMSTCYFPWNAMISLSGPAGTLIRSLQFPHRLLAPAAVLLTFTCCFAVSALHDLYGRHITLPFLLSALTLTAVNCGWYFYDYTFSGDPYRVYDTKDLDTLCLYSCEYLPTGTVLENIEDNLIVPSEGVSLTDYQKKGTTITCNVTASADEGYIDFPLTLYKYYICRDSAGELLELSPGYNNMIRVSFPADYSGSISIMFQEPLHWRLSELLSLLTLLGLGCFPLLRKCRSARPGKEP